MNEHFNQNHLAATDSVENLFSFEIFSFRSVFSVYYARVRYKKYDTNKYKLSIEPYGIKKENQNCFHIRVNLLHLKNIQLQNTCCISRQFYLISGALLSKKVNYIEKRVPVKVRH